MLVHAAVDVGAFHQLIYIKSLACEGRLLHIFPPSYKEFSINQYFFFAIETLIFNSCRYP